METISGLSGVICSTFIQAMYLSCYPVVIFIDFMMLLDLFLFGEIRLFEAAPQTKFF